MSIHRDSQRPTAKLFIVKVSVDAKGSSALVHTERRDICERVPLDAQASRHFSPGAVVFMYARVDRDGSIALEPVEAPAQAW